MKIFVSHTSSLEYWRSAPLPLARSRQRKVLHLPPAECSADKVGSMYTKALNCCSLDVLSRPVHLLVLDTTARSRCTQILCHIHPEVFPPGSFIRVERDVFVSTPELSFVQAASQLSFPKLVELGFELCGGYRRLPNEPEGFCSGPPLTSPAALISFVGKVPAERGVRSARRALQYIVSGSASPMETVLVLLLCLPRRLGGYGLPIPKMNYRIDARARGRKTTTKRYFVCDLFWPEVKLAVEYDSDRYHTGSDRIADDASRRASLASMGIEVVTVTRRQTFNSGELENVACLLSKRLGKRLRSRKCDWSLKQQELRAQLLSFRKEK